MPPTKTPTNGATAVALAPVLSNGSGHLVGLDPVLEIIHVALLTSFVENSIPISIMLVAPSGGGKTQTLKRMTADFIHKTNDLTTSGLWSILKDDKEQKLSHICLEDFNPVLSHKSSVSSLTIATMLSVMADGIIRVDDGRESKQLLHKPVGIITGVTPEMFQQHLEKWQGLGFVRRFLPIHFSYTMGTIDAAQASVRNGSITAKPLPEIKIEIPLRKSAPEITPDIGHKLETMSVYLGTHLGVNSVVTKSKTGAWEREYQNGKAILPMAPHIILRTMAQARAIKNGRETVNLDDIKFLQKLVDFANPMNPVQL